MPKPRVVRHEVTQPLNESYRLIPLTQNQNAIVDVEDFEWLSQWYWMAMFSPEADTFYVIRRSNGKRSECIERSSSALRGKRLTTKTAMDSIIGNKIFGHVPMLRTFAIPSPPRGSTKESIGTNNLNGGAA